MKQILILEDDILLNKTLAYNLSMEGYKVVSVFSCKEARTALKKTSFQLALLDINLPDGSGLAVCDEIKIRDAGTYIMFLTANDRESDMLRGYEAGAADYITKPFSILVLCKKIAAVFDAMEQHVPQRDIYDDGALVIDFSEQSATLNGAKVDFTPKEYRTLYQFIQNPGILLTKQTLLEKLWDIDGDFVDEHTLTTIISRIRKKIETEERKYIKTSYGIGYQWIGGKKA